MGTIPLPALSIKAPEQPDTLQQFGQLLQLQRAKQQMEQQKQMAPLAVQQQQQENQIRGQQIKDQQAMTAAMQQWDGKDYDSLASAVLKNGGSSQAVMGLKQHALDLRKTYSQIAKDDAETGAKNVETRLKTNDLVSGKLASVLQLPDEQLGQGITSAAQELAQNGMIDPQHAQMAAQLAQMPPQQARQQLEILRKGYQADSQMLNEEAKKAEIAQSQAATAKSQMEVAQGGTSDTARYISSYLKANNLEDTPANRLKAQRQYIKESKTDPMLARTQVYMQMPTEVADPNNPGETINVSRKDAVGMKGKGSASVQTPKAEAKYMTSGKGGQQLTAFNTAIVHLNTLDRLSADLNNTDLQVVNRAKQAWAEQTGNPAPANFAAAVNAMSGEVAAALKASGATDQEIAHVGATFSRAQSPAQLKGAINTYRELLKGKAAQLRKQYESGMQGKPAFDESQSPANDPFAQFGGKAHN